MKDRVTIRSFSFLIFIAGLFFSPASWAQDDSGETKGIDSGNYNIQQSVEFGYRENLINGNRANFNTFVNLASGVRLFDYTLNMRSLDHQGILFDNLSFSNFGYGGDPENVSRLRIEKNKWYDFRGLFRRYKNTWNWNLLANPLNLATSVVPTPITFSPHALDLSRRMQDYDLTLLPQSRVRFRLGYSRNVDAGPAFTTLDSGTEPQFTQAFRTTANAYRAGIDFRFLPKTIISYDQFLRYYKQDTSVTDQNVGKFQLTDGTPVDLGIIWTATATSGTPCGAPIIDSTTSPPTVKAACNGFLSYSDVGRPRNFMPTESLRFQSSYFKNLEMTGSVGYSSSDNTIPDFTELMNGWVSRTAQRGTTAAGPAKATRVSVNADFSGIYSVTDKFRILDIVHYDNWRIPGAWTFAQQNLFATQPQAAGQAGMLLPIAVFNSTNCPVDPSTGLSQNIGTCPQHPAGGATSITSGSAADSLAGLDSRFLGQRLLSNTIEFEYDFTRRFGARIGYLYTSRTIADFNAAFFAAETFFPGGPSSTTTGAAPAELENDFYAARGDCAPESLVTGEPATLPSGCTLNPDGSVTFTGPGESDTQRNITDIHEHLLLFGMTARPVDKLRITGDFGFGYNDKSFTRTSPRQVQSYKVHVNYTPKQWANLDGAIDIHENRDNVTGLLDCPTTANPTLICPSPVNDLEHDRMYSFTTVLTPNPRLAIDFGYNYWDFFTQTDICYASSVAGQPTTPCPSGSASPVGLGAQSVYNSTNHYAYGGLMWKVVKRVTVGLGFGGSFVRGSSVFFNQPQFAPAPPPPVPALGQVQLNALTPVGTLDFNYLKPYGSIAIDVYKGLSYKTSWGYYGFNEKGFSDPVTLAPLGSQDFNGSLLTFSFRYAF